MQHYTLKSGKLKIKYIIRKERRTQCRTGKAVISPSGGGRGRRKKSEKSKIENKIH
jgi:hypothetical protein